MNEWAKIIFASLLSGFVVFVGNYTAMQVQAGQVEIRLDKLERVQNERSPYVNLIISNQERLKTVESVISSLGPDLKELSRGVNALNVNLESSNGTIGLNTQRLEQVVTSQSKMSDDIKEINRQLRER